VLAPPAPMTCYTGFCKEPISAIEKKFLYGNFLYVYITDFLNGREDKFCGFYPTSTIRNPQSDIRNPDGTIFGIFLT
jgi:hypothetical protein